MIKEANKIQTERNQSQEMTSKTDKIHSLESRKSELFFPSISLFILFVIFVVFANEKL
jgi:hypothetical protein